jgi:hypothetical protein
MRRHPVPQAGFAFIEVVIVVVVIKLLVALVITLLPRVSESSRRVQSINNVRNLLDLTIMRQIRRGWPHYDGKNFVLHVVAAGDIDVRNRQLLEVFFSPGDTLYSLGRVDVERYKEINVTSLKHGDFHELTSYAGRRNADKEFVITADQEARGVPVICDDDDGPLHHRDGIIVGYTNRSVRLMEWEELGIEPPDPRDPEPFLGDAATTDELRALSSH